MPLETYFKLLAAVILKIDQWIRSLNITVGGVQIGINQLYGIACVGAILKTLLGRDDFELGGDGIIDI